VAETDGEPMNAASATRSNPTLFDDATLKVPGFKDPSTFNVVNN